MTSIASVPFAPPADPADLFPRLRGAVFARDLAKPVRDRILSRHVGDSTTRRMETLVGHQVEKRIHYAIAHGLNPSGTFTYTGRQDDIFRIKVDKVPEDGKVTVTWRKNNREWNRFLFYCTTEQLAELAKNELRRFMEDVDTTGFILDVGVVVEIPTAFNGKLTVKLTTKGLSCMTYVLKDSGGKILANKTVHFAHATAVAPKKGGNEKKPRFKKGQKQK